MSQTTIISSTQPYQHLPNPDTIRTIAKQHKLSPNYVFIAFAFMNPTIRIIALVGGTRSGKTHSALEFLIDLAYAHPTLQGTISLVRETTASLRNSLERQFIDILTKRQLFDENNYHITAREYKLNKIKFDIFGADNPQKLRGSEREILFANEVNGFKYFSFNELALRTKYKIIIDFNPTVLPHHFLYTEVLNRPDCATFKSNYLDNLHNLPASQIREIEMLKITNPERYKTMGLGEQATLQGAIYPHWEIGDYSPADNEILVMDLGYNDPTTATLMSKKYSEKHQREVFYAKNIYYERFKDPSQIVEDLKKLGVADKKIVCDISPQITALFKNKGLHVINPIKGNAKFTKVDAVKLFQSEMVIMDRYSKHLHSEQAGYTWKYVDALNSFVDELNDGNDHILDALLYGYMTCFANRDAISQNTFQPYIKRFSL